MISTPFSPLTVSSLSFLTVSPSTLFPPSPLASCFCLYISARSPSPFSTLARKQSAQGHQGQGTAKHGGWLHVSLPCATPPRKSWVPQHSLIIGTTRKYGNVAIPVQLPAIQPSHLSAVMDRPGRLRRAVEAFLLSLQENTPTNSISSSTIAPPLLTRLISLTLTYSLFSTTTVTTATATTTTTLLSSSGILSRTHSAIWVSCNAWSMLSFMA
ncbi:uncharacterized protein HMPREF1120_01641 [Exophiala dermatitidis NIH/UT8656]|uniref:Uncharacterized protein n=1 Tax=Exophiala dermatitidis (strain ATCC 34100 / CBS 525.76 / NIH/UT8656) TaxID=858893 RepID=H6BSZ9_EXODN|nr:uncharacterized protein HMPREF1120_01641 [Exophiala dermatitidis NIH/UT8656]EHY53448.1 hypothetical protein HMPREF1120_01641 [Exophiala dermatitidis NIH/UT8656]